MRRWLSLIFIILAIVLGSLLGVLNATPVAIDLLFVQFASPLGLALSVALVLGLLLGAGVLWLFRVLPLRARLKRLQREARQSSTGTPSNKAPTLPTVLPADSGDARTHD